MKTPYFEKIVAPQGPPQLSQLRCQLAFALPSPLRSIPWPIYNSKPTEFQEFSNQLKEAGEGRGKSLTIISLAISILAVLVAMIPVLGHRSHTEAVLMQSRAGDQWNEYQAKKIRIDNLSVTVDLLGMQPAAAASNTKLAEYTAHTCKMEG